MIIDLQKDFFTLEYADRTRAAEVCDSLVANTNRLLRAAREQDFPIIFVVTSYRPDRSDWTLLMKDLDRPVCIEGTDGERSVQDLEAEPQDRVVKKTRYSGFYNTDLEAILRSLKVENLVICGINTHACVRSTVVDAFMRDYRIWIPRECVASYDRAGHERSLDYLSRRMARVVSLDEMLRRVGQQDLDFRFEPH